MRADGVLYVVEEWDELAECWEVAAGTCHDALADAHHERERFVDRNPRLRYRITRYVREGDS